MGFYAVPVSNITLFAKWGFHGLVLSPASLNFGSGLSGYLPVTPQTVTVTNTGNLPSGALAITNSNPSAFTVSVSSIGSLSEGESGSFSVGVASGLSKGVYSAVITVTGDNESASLNVQFVVDPIPVASASVSSVTPPQTDAVPVNSAVKADAGNYSIIDVNWSPSSSTFQPEVVYTVLVTLTSDAEYTFYGLSSALINGQSASISVSDNGVNAIISYQFAVTAARIITGITVDTDPKLNYVHGDTLDLSLLSVRIDYDTGFYENVSYTELSSRNIAISHAQGQLLSHSDDDGGVITLSHTNSPGTVFSVPVDPLAVGKAPGALTAVPTLNSHTIDSLSPVSVTFIFNTVSSPSNGQTVEYAINTSNTPPSSGWSETVLTYSSLSGDTSYYFFARTIDNDNFLTGTASISSPVGVWSITFDTDSGSAPPSVQHKLSGQKADEVSEPVKTNHLFTGWRVNNTETLWDFAASTVTQKTTLTAKWAPNAAAITLTVEEIIDKAPSFPDVVLSRSGSGGNSKTQTITVVSPSAYESIRWEIDGTGVNAGTIISGTASSFMINAEDIKYNSLGGHTLRLFVKTGGVEYMRNINFTIVL